MKARTGITSKEMVIVLVALVVVVSVFTYAVISTGVLSSG